MVLPGFFLLAVLSVSATLVAATDHIVGGHLGWNLNINYSLWSNNQTFIPGDLISFRYQKTMYSVFEVNRTGYDNCTLDGAVGNWSSGKDFIPLNKPGMYYFICGNGFCLNGMKVAVRVQPLLSNTSSSPAAATKPGKEEASPAPEVRPLAALVLGAISSWIGSGLI